MSRLEEPTMTPPIAIICLKVLSEAKETCRSDTLKLTNDAAKIEFVSSCNSIVSNSRYLELSLETVVGIFILYRPCLNGHFIGIIAHFRFFL